MVEENKKLKKNYKIMQKKILLIGGIVIIVLILIGISFNYGYRLGMREEVVIEVPRILGLEISPIIRSQHANAEGEIAEILDRTLALTANGDTLEIPIIDEARIVVLEPGDDEGVMALRDIEFRDLKVGDTVEVLIELMPGGLFEGVHVMVSPDLPEQDI